MSVLIGQYSHNVITSFGQSDLELYCIAFACGFVGKKDSTVLVLIYCFSRVFSLPCLSQLNLPQLQEGLQEGGDQGAEEGRQEAQAQPQGELLSVRVQGAEAGLPGHRPWAS